MKRLLSTILIATFLFSPLAVFAGEISTEDPEGKYLETAFDVAMFGLSWNDFRQKPSFWNGVGVLADGASLFLPIPAIVGGIRHADDAVKFLKGANRVDNAADVGKISSKYNWGNSGLLKDHTRRHASDFGLAKDNYEGYAQKANDFYKQYGKNGIDVKIDSKSGDVLMYESKSNTFGSYNQSGQTKSFYKPDPAKNGGRSGQQYFNDQRGRMVLP